MAPTCLSPRVLLAAPDRENPVEDDTLELEGMLKDRLEALESRILRETLIRHRWNKSRAAKELGLSRVGLRLKLQRHNLENVHQLQVPVLRKATG